MDSSTDASNAGHGNSRTWLFVKAVTMRVLMRIGMFFHGFPHIFAAKPSFTRTVLPTTAIGPNEKIDLNFFVPDDYERERRRGKRYPVVVNFHGGGFTLGKATDDHRWIVKVVETTHAVVVSVDYRLAPEHPFPTAVDDGVDALLYLESKADELALDISRVVLTGFSSGGNLVFTVPYRLHYGRASNMSLMDLHKPRTRPQTIGATTYFDHPHSTNYSIPDNDLSAVEAQIPPTVPEGSSDDGGSSPDPSNPFQTPKSQSKNGHDHDLHRELTISHAQVYPVNHENGSYLSLPSEFYPHDPNTLPLRDTRSPASRLRIVGIFSWYPLLDFVLPRSLRRVRSENPDKTLAPFLTDLFDESYAPVISDRYSPFASPGRASEQFIRESLPDHIFMYICQWDMLFLEAQELVTKLQKTGKQVRSMMMERTTHAWDKSVNPFRDKQQIDIIYEDACYEMLRLLDSGK
ncbi:hypothetical protein KEM56_006357 [Ascosphaera pollenicola]|nr:hypothetical protein KEM56_006357 [Ascosphaera pollenicola]